MKVVLETRRLRLQELEPTDVENLSEILEDPVAMRYYPAPFSREQVASWIARARDSYRDNGFGLWAVIRRSDGRFLGDCGPMLQPVDGALIPEIGYHIVAAEQGQGFATEAARDCLEWVFANTTYDIVCSLVTPENGPSRAVAAKVHGEMRQFIWQKHNRQMCLYWTDRPSESQRGAY